MCAYVWKDFLSRKRSRLILCSGCCSARRGCANYRRRGICITTHRSTDVWRKSAAAQTGWSRVARRLPNFDARTYKQGIDRLASLVAANAIQAFFHKKISFPSLGKKRRSIVHDHIQWTKQFLQWFSTNKWFVTLNTKMCILTSAMWRIKF